MDVSEYFLRTIDDLRGRLAHPDYYNVTCAAALVRKLLLDSCPLAHAVNRELRIKLQFRMYSLPVDGTNWTLAIAEPNARFPDGSLVDLGRFLTSVCFAVGTESFTVKDVIQCCAHVRGGVHIGSPDQRQRVMTGTADRANINPQWRNPNSTLLPLSIGMMAGIGGVVVDGLQPLVNAIRTQKKFTE